MSLLILLSIMRNITFQFDVQHFLVLLFSMSLLILLSTVSNITFLFELTYYSLFIYLTKATLLVLLFYLPLVLAFSSGICSILSQLVVSSATETLNPQPSALWDTRACIYWWHVVLIDLSVDCIVPINGRDLGLVIEWLAFDLSLSCALPGAHIRPARHINLSCCSMDE